MRDGKANRVIRPRGAGPCGPYMNNIWWVCRWPLGRSLAHLPYPLGSRHVNRIWPNELHRSTASRERVPVF
jgi:hypothetical protein